MGKFSLILDGYLIGGLNMIAICGWMQGWYELMFLAIVIFAAMIGITINDYKKMQGAP